MKVTGVACCVICGYHKSYLVEIGEFAATLCKYCIDGITPVSVIAYKGSRPDRMAVDLKSQNSVWRLRVLPMKNFSEAQVLLYELIDQLIDVKLSVL